LATQTPPCGALGVNGSVLTLSSAACAVQLRPNTIILSIGTNDALQSLTLGLPPTNPTTFSAQYATLLGILSGTGAKIVVLNLPDVAALPFAITASDFDAKCHFQAAGASPGDFVVPNLVNPASNSGNICSNYAVRPGALVAQAGADVKLYNISIAALAAKFGATLVDLNGLFAHISAHGYEVGGQRLTTDFLGGLFSLDGLHPTNTGHAIVANETIKTMNEKLGTGIPPLSVEQIAKTDPLVTAKQHGNSK